MVALMLNDLRGVPGEAALPLLPRRVEVFHLDVPVARSAPPALERKAAFLRVVGRVLSDDDRVEHHADRADDYRALSHAYHVGGHADAALAVGGKGVPEVPGEDDVVLGAGQGLLPQEYDVLYDGSDQLLSAKLLGFTPSFQ